jgi:hypothetical protein
MFSAAPRWAGGQGAGVGCGGEGIVGGGCEGEGGMGGGCGSEGGVGGGLTLELGERKRE